MTETAAISHSPEAGDRIKSVRDLGAHMALDDFGSGLSSFGCLKNMPIDIIKIDDQFVKEIVLNRIDREIVRAIQRLALAIGIKMVTEFVDDQAILDELIRLQIDFAQGYHIGKPLPVAEAMTQLLKLNRAA